MPNCKPETVLRILRSYRLCLLHEYCHNLLRDVYVETIKLQTIQVCNDLRIKSQLFPKAKHRRDRLFKVHFGEEIERLSFNQSQFLKDDQIEQYGQQTSVDDILSAQICSSSIFYIPSTKEILFTDRYDSDQTPALHREMIEANPLNVESLEKDIKEFAVLPTSTLYEV